MSGLRARLAATLRDRLGVPGIGSSLRRLKRRVLQADCVFARPDAAWRADKRWGG